MTVQIHAEPLNGTPKRLVVASEGGKELYTSTINTADGWARTCFAREVKKRRRPGDRYPTPEELANWNPSSGCPDLELDEDRLADEVLRVANEADAKELARIEASGESEIVYRHLSSAELFSGDFKPSYIIEGVLAENEQCLWAGPEKGMKTSTGIDAAVAIDLGGYWLGYFPVPRRRQVAVMSGEAGAVFLQDVGRRTCIAAGHDPMSLGIEWFLDLPILGDERHRAPLSKMLVDFGVEVLFLDCSYLMIEGDGREGSLFFMGSLLRWITEICRAENVTLVLVHHALKKPVYTPISLADVAWAGFGPWAAQWVLVNRREEFDPNSGTHRLWLSIGSRVGHGGRWCVDIEEGSHKDECGRIWQASVTTPSEAKERSEGSKAQRKAEAEDRKLEADRQAVVNVMVKHPAGETKTFFRERAPLGNNRFNVVWATLLDDETIVSAGEVKKGNGPTYPTFKARLESDD